MTKHIETIPIAPSSAPAVERDIVTMEEQIQAALDRVSSTKPTSSSEGSWLFDKDEIRLGVTQNITQATDASGEQGLRAAIGGKRVSLQYHYSKSVLREAGQQFGPTEVHDARIRYRHPVTDNVSVYASAGYCQPKTDLVPNIFHESVEQTLQNNVIPRGEGNTSVRVLEGDYEIKGNVCGGVGVEYRHGPVSVSVGYDLKKFDEHWSGVDANGTTWELDKTRDLSGPTVAVDIHLASAAKAVRNVRFPSTGEIGRGIKDRLSQTRVGVVAGSNGTAGARAEVPLTEKVSLVAQHDRGAPLGTGEARVGEVDFTSIGVEFRQPITKNVSVFANMMKSNASTRTDRDKEFQEVVGYLQREHTPHTGRPRDSFIDGTVRVRNGYSVGAGVSYEKQQGRMKGLRVDVGAQATGVHQSNAAWWDEEAYRNRDLSVGWWTSSRDEIYTRMYISVMMPVSGILRPKEG